jgi:hypothetical protein
MPQKSRRQMTAKKSPNCKTQAERIDAREIGLIAIKGQALVLTDLASYHFVVNGCAATGIHAIAALNHGRDSARRMASQLLNGKLPRKITATNAATIAWMELRAESADDAKCARILDGVRSAFEKAARDGTNWVDSLPDCIVCDASLADDTDYVGSLADGRAIYSAPYTMAGYTIA